MESRSTAFGFLAVLTALACALVLAAVAASPAFAMETERWTAKSNQDSGNQIMGGTPTRVTWQGQSAEDESVATVSLALPEGTVVDAANVAVTVLDGLERLDFASAVTTDGAQVNVAFDEAAPAGAMIDRKSVV